MTCCYGKDSSELSSAELYADRTRALPVVDPEDRELTISSGVARGHLLLAIRHFGYDYNLKILPALQGKEDLLAQVIIENIDSKPVAFSSSSNQGKPLRSFLNKRPLLPQ